MKRLALVVPLFAACGTDAPPPTCEAALSHFYDEAHCTFVDSNDGSPLGETAVEVTCESLKSHFPQCEGAIDTWLRCSNDVDAATCQADDCQAKLEAAAQCR